MNIHYKTKATKPQDAEYEARSIVKLEPVLKYIPNIIDLNRHAGTKPNKLYNQTMQMYSKCKQRNRFRSIQAAS